MPSGGDDDDDTVDEADGEDDSGKCRMDGKLQSFDTVVEQPLPFDRFRATWFVVAHGRKVHPSPSLETGKWDEWQSIVQEPETSEEFPKLYISTPPALHSPPGIYAGVRKRGFCSW